MDSHQVVAVIACLAMVASIPGQETLLDLRPSPIGVYPFVDGFGSVSAMSDVDGDGCGDFITLTSVFSAPFSLAWDGLVIVSGVTGRPIFTLPSSPPGSYVYYRFGDCGDMDGDGRSDVATVSMTHNLAQRITTVSSASQQALWSTSGPRFSDSYDTMACKLDTDGDGLSDIVGCVTNGPSPRIVVINHFGAVRYTLPLSIYLTPVSVAGIGDVDGDGADEFVYGRMGPTTTGYAVLVNGRTGATMHTVQGQPGDNMGWTVAGVGDMNGDGVPDYAAGTVSAHYLAVFSGLTGGIIHEWRQAGGAGQEVGGYAIEGHLDIDQDLIPDIVTSPWGGRIVAYSGRDGGVLWIEVCNAESLANLGPQPGSPYPVVADNEPTFTDPITNRSGRLRTIRTSVPGGSVQLGQGCAASGAVPKIGYRRAGNGLRLTIAGGPPSGLAWLALGTSTLSYQGLALPLALDPFGMTGCSLLVAPETVTVRVLGSTGIDAGYAAADFAGTPTSGLGQDFYAQWIAIGTGTGAAFATTPAQQLRLQ